MLFPQDVYSRELILHIFITSIEYTISIYINILAAVRKYTWKVRSCFHNCTRSWDSLSTLASSRGEAGTILQTEFCFSLSMHRKTCIFTAVSPYVGTCFFFLYYYNINTSGLQNKLILPKAKPPYKDKHKTWIHIFTFDKVNNKI